ncbi:MAG TPA: hypothetical protein VMU77_05615, partial [Acidimicrobiales bacterium]|nr:hypothetical protein [Acidimicrobiales bacterium]
RAVELLEARRARLAETGGVPAKRSKASRTASKGTAKKSAAKKSAAKKSVAKKMSAPKIGTKTKAAEPVGIAAANGAGDEDGSAEIPSSD